MAELRRYLLAGRHHVVDPGRAPALDRRGHREARGDIAGAVVQQYTDAAGVDLGLFIVERTAARRSRGIRRSVAPAL